MEFDPVWILLSLPVAFGLGWLASRFDIHQLRLENKRVPKAYFKGLNFLLNEQQDKAIDAFIEAVQNDPDTSDLHFALGNLFRRRGEYDRAVRVHKHLLERGDLSHSDQERAQYSLALDYLKAGLLDHAEEALAALEGTSHEAQARLARLSIYERSREWPQAVEIAEKMGAAHQGDFSVRKAHYLCEQALNFRKGGNNTAAENLLRQATASAPDSARAQIELSRLLQDTQRPDEAYDAIVQVRQRSPMNFPLAAPLLLDVARQCGKIDEASRILLQTYAQTPSLNVLDAIAQLDSPHARTWYMRHLEQKPSLVAATQWLKDAPLDPSEAREPIMRALNHAMQPLTRYRCAACGFEARQHFWQCPGCQSWDSFPPRRIEEL